MDEVVGRRERTLKVDCRWSLRDRQPESVLFGTGTRCAWLEDVLFPTWLFLLLARNRLSFESIIRIGKRTSHRSIVSP